MVNSANSYPAKMRRAKLPAAGRAGRLAPGQKNDYLFNPEEVLLKKGYGNGNDHAVVLISINVGFLTTSSYVNPVGFFRGGKYFLFPLNAVQYNIDAVVFVALALSRLTSWSLLQSRLSRDTTESNFF